MSNLKTEEPALTVREYALQEGITLQTVYRRIWNGQVQARQIYGRWLISADSVEDKHSRQRHVEQDTAVVAVSA